MKCEHLTTKNIKSNKLPNGNIVIEVCTECNSYRYKETIKGGGTNNSKWYKSYVTSK